MSVVNNTVPAGGDLYGGTGSTCNSGANGCLLNDVGGATGAMKPWPVIYGIVCSLLVASWACFAQVPMTGAGKGATGVAYTPCAGTAIHTVSPNDLATGDWSATNITAAYGLSDPLSGSTASSLTSTTSAGASIFTGTTFTMTGGVTYAFGAYFKPISGPTWVNYIISDNTANAFAYYFDISNLVVGSPSNVGNGHATCAAIAASTNGYAILSFAGNYSVTNIIATLQIGLADANGSGNAANGRKIYAWQVSP